MAREDKSRRDNITIGLVEKSETLKFDQPGVYCIVNPVSGKCYVGSTIRRIDYRYRRHICQLRKKTHKNAKLLSAFIKNGESFYCLVLSNCEVRDVISSEQGWMDKLKPSYNLCPVADVYNFGSKHAVTDLEKQNDRRLNAFEKLAKSHTGRKASQETKNKISAALTGRKMTEEQRQKNKEINKGRKWSVNVEARKEALRERNKIHAREWCAMGHKAIRDNPELRAKQISSRVGLKKTEETKRKISEANKKAYAKKKTLNA